MDIKEYMQTVGRQARAASRRMATASTAEKNAALLAIAAAIRREKAALVAANQEDLAAARAAGLETAMLDRLTLSEKGVDSMAEGVEQVATLPDPIGEISEFKFRPPASRSARCACRSASSASSTKRARTSPPTPPRCA